MKSPAAFGTLESLDSKTPAPESLARKVLHAAEQSLGQGRPSLYELLIFVFHGVTFQDGLTAFACPIFPQLTISGVVVHARRPCLLRVGSVLRHGNDIGGAVSPKLSALRPPRIQLQVLLLSCCTANVT